MLCAILLVFACMKALLSCTHTHIQNMCVQQRDKAKGGEGKEKGG